MDYLFRLIEPTESDWQKIEASPDHTCFHSSGWSNYLNHIGRKPFIVHISADNKDIGYFIGAKRRLIITLLGSPTDSSGTYCQGLCLSESSEPEERIDIYKQIFRWVRKQYHIHYMQICDWQLRTVADQWTAPTQFNFHALEAAHIPYTIRTTFFVDTRASEQQLWANLNYKSCKYAINKAQKEGLTVRQIERKEDIPAFIDIHHRQIQDVFKRKGMKPMHYQRKEHLMTLCESLFPDKVIMLQVWGKDCDGQEQCMSSAIFCPGKAASTYFTGASFRQYMKYCPNELMVWDGMKRLHAMGAGDLIFTGIAHYKKKFGSIYASLPMMVFTSFGILFTLRTFIKKTYGRMRNILSKQ